MPLTRTEQARVKNALHRCHRNDERAAVLERLESIEEIHQFAINYNVNDGLLPVWHLIRSPCCDRGTALYLYWQFNEVFMDSDRQSHANADPEWDTAGLVSEIERRFASGFYASQEIAFDPRLAWDWLPEEQEQFDAGTISFPREMLDATPGRAIEQEWF